MINLDPKIAVRGHSKPPGISDYRGMKGFKKKVEIGIKSSLKVDRERKESTHGFATMGYPRNEPRGRG